ncbi:helix-turn-helix domain-containing protein [Stenotrophomonas maltophilia]|nr:helix-turn-helix domain-containing protein [Stenotrophomonas maltophilia]
MNLIDFCTYQGGTGAPSCPVLRRMAARTGVAIRTLYMIARGHKLPGARLCSRLEAYTNGAVRREDLRPDIFRGEKLPLPTPPAGFVLVPLVLPEEMEIAFMETWVLKRRCIDDPQMQDAWEAALAARPEVKP